MVFGVAGMNLTRRLAEGSADLNAPPLPPTPPKSGAGYFVWSVIVCSDSMIDTLCVSGSGRV